MYAYNKEFVGRGEEITSIWNSYPIYSYSNIWPKEEKRRTIHPPILKLNKVVFFQSAAKKKNNENKNNEIKKI